MRRELISKKTRNEFREFLVGWTLHEITMEFEAADIVRDETYKPPGTGERRSLVEQFYHGLDFTEPRDVQKLLRAYEGILNTATQRRLVSYGGADEQRRVQEAIERLVSWLRKDGYVFEHGRISPAAGGLAFSGMKAKAVEFSAQYMADEIRRIEDAVLSDPAQAIGSAKELVETCCKTILSECGKPCTDKPDVLPLVRRTMEELQLLPDGIPESAKGSRAIKALLGNLSTVVQSLAELRNLYGTGHGKDGRTKGLCPRHARLAVGAATTLAFFLFDTHGHRTAASRMPATLP